MSWEDRPRRMFRQFAEQLEVDGEWSAAQRTAQGMIRDHPDAAYLVYVAGWISAMGYIEATAAISAGADPDDDEESAL